MEVNAISSSGFHILSHSPFQPRHLCSSSPLASLSLALPRPHLNIPVKGQHNYSHQECLHEDYSKKKKKSCECVHSTLFELTCPSASIFLSLLLSYTHTHTYIMCVQDCMARVNALLMFKRGPGEANASAGFRY